MKLSKCGSWLGAAAFGIFLLGMGGCASNTPKDEQQEISRLNEEYRERARQERPGKLLAQQAGQIFRSEPFIEMAMALQALSKKDAESQLRNWANSGKYDDEVIILCSLLFTDKNGQPLPKVKIFSEGYSTGHLNGGYGIGMTHEPDWPDWPVIVVEGVPFLIAADYEGLLTGDWEPGPLPPLLAPIYLKYCLSEGQWTTQRYSRTTLAARQQALDELLKLPTWKRDLNEQEIQYLTYQIGNDPPPMPVYRGANGKMD